MRTPNRLITFIKIVYMNADISVRDLLSTRKRERCVPHMGKFGEVKGALTDSLLTLKCLRETPLADNILVSIHDEPYIFFN